MKHLLLILAFLFSLAFAQNVQVGVFTKTSGFNHGSGGPNGSCMQMLQDLSLNHNWTPVHITEADFTQAGLAPYGILFFNNTSGTNLLNAAQKAALVAWVDAGGDVVSNHAASDAYWHSSANGNNTGQWDWYAEQITGCSVQRNPNHTASNFQADIYKTSTVNCATNSISNQQNYREEYYYWLPGGYLNTAWTTLMMVERTGGQSYDAPRMIAQYYEHPGTGSKRFYTSLGHDNQHYTNPNKGFTFKALIDQAITCMVNDASLHLIWPEEKPEVPPSEDGYFILNDEPPVPGYRVYTLQGQEVHRGNIKGNKMPVYDKPGVWLYMSYGKRFVAGVR